MGPSALESGFSALAAARWQEAHDLLVQAVAESPSGIALEALGEACSWLDDVDTIEVRERAYRYYCGRVTRGVPPVLQLPSHSTT